MVIIVTGGAGFIGSALVRYLINEDMHTVINIDNLSYSGNLKSIPNSKNSQKYIFENCDIANKNEIAKLVLK